MENIKSLKGKEVRIISKEISEGISLPIIFETHLPLIFQKEVDEK